MARCYQNDTGIGKLYDIFIYRLFVGLGTSPAAGLAQPQDKIVARYARTSYPYSSDDSIR